MSEWEPTWDEWLASLRKRDRLRAGELLEKFRRAGCSEDPEGWVRSEIEEGIAQLARFVILRAIWNFTLQQWRDALPIDRVPAAERLLRAGASPDDVRLLCGSVAYQTAYDVLYILSLGEDPTLEPTAQNDLPGWKLMERAPRSDDELTGRRVDFLYESLSSVDPAGTEAHDFWPGD